MTTTQFQASTKLVQIRLAALVRLEHTEVVEVPANFNKEELQQLVNRRYQDVDGGEYVSDPDYWERAHCYAATAGEGDEPTLKATRDGDGLRVERIEGPLAQLETPAG